MGRRKKVPKQVMPVPKNGRSTKQGQKRPEEKQQEPPNGNMNGTFHLVESDSGDLLPVEITKGSSISRDSSGSRIKGTNKTSNGDAIVNGNGKANGVNVTIKHDDERAKSSLQANKSDTHNAVNGCRIFSASGRNKSSYASKTGGGARKLNGQSNGKPDPVRIKHQELNKSKLANPSSQVSYANSALIKSNEEEDALTKDNAVIKKYSEEPLSFFQPDLGKLTPEEPTSPSVEELCAKWPSIGPNQDPEYSDPEVSSHRKNLLIKKNTPVQSRNSSPVPNDVPTKEQVPKKEAWKKWDYPKLPPRLIRNQNNPKASFQNIDGHSNINYQPADSSSHVEYNSAKIQPSVDFSESSGRSLQSGDVSNAWTNGQRSSPHKSDPSGFTQRSNPNHFNGDENHDKPKGEYYDGMNSRNPYHSSQGRGQGGLHNSAGWGGPKRNKNGKKFNNPNGYQSDGKKHFARLGQGQQSLMGLDGKEGPPVGYYSNCDAYSGQNLVSNLPPLMGSPGMQPMMNQMDSQPQMMSPVMHPQMMGPHPVGPPVQFADDRQYTMAVFPNGYQWIDVGGLQENQQVFLQPNGEVIPLTMANMMPFVVPYTSGLPNTGVPMLIPAVAPPMAGMNGQATINGHNLNGNSLYSDTHTFNAYGNPPAPTISHSVSSCVGPITACTETQNDVTQSQLEKTWESGTPTRFPSEYSNASYQSPSGTSYHRSDTPKSAIQPNRVSSSIADLPTRAQTPGTPLNGTPRIVISDTVSTNDMFSDSNEGTPGARNVTPGSQNVTPSTSAETPGPANDTGSTSATPCTPQNDEQTNVQGENSPVKMMSLEQVEQMQRMSSANGKRVPMNARNKDSPNHMPPPPQEVQEELVKFICDSWNKVHQESLKGNTSVAYYDDPCPLEGFVPFDLEAYWGQRLVDNITNQNIPTQNM